MKTIQCKVSCEYWNRSHSYTIEVPDDATPEQIEHEMLLGAIEESAMEYWQEDSGEDE